MAVLVTVCVVALALVAGVIVFFVVRPGKPAPVAATAPSMTTTAPQPPTASSRRTPSSSPRTSTSTPTSSPSVTPTDPADVVRAFYDAVNARDFATAWALGGKNLGHTYAEFAGGFAGTLHDDLTITSVTGNTVKVSVVATESGGVSTTYEGSYTVRDGEIVTGTMKKAG